MNYKRCALRNNLKERAIRILAKGVDIEAFSNLVENEEGRNFLDTIADDLEKKIENARGVKTDYDATEMNALLDISRKSLYPEDIAKTLSRTILTIAKNGDPTIKMDASQKWIAAKGVVETEITRYNLYVFDENEIKEMVLNTFIMMVIEESGKDTAGRLSVTEGCKKKNVNADQYENWLEK